MASNAIRISILANGSQARSELTKTASAADSISSKFSKFRLPASVALGGIAVGAKKAVDAASDLNETISKTDQIFGAQSKAIQKFASGAATSLGQSKTAALDAAANFGLIGQKAGLSGSETAAFATKFTGLASDLASFNNTTPEEAVTAIGAAMRGESEPIRKYGVLLDDATLRARALKLGLISNVKQGLTPQQKALAASQEILAQTTKAQGDFARTSDGAANKQRILAAKSENLKAKLGQGLLPAYEGVLELLSKFATFMANNTGLVKGAVIAIAALATVMLAASAAQKIYTTGLVIFNAVSKTIVAVTKAWQIAQIALNIAMLINPIGVIVIAIVAFIAICVLAYKKVAVFRQGVQAAWNGIKAATAAVWNFIKALISKVVSVIAAVVKRYFNTYKAIVTGVWNAIRTATSAAWNGIKSVVTKTISAVTTAVSGIKGKVTGALKGAATWLLDIGKNVVEGLIEGIKSMGGKVKDVLVGLLPGPLKKFAGKLGIASPSRLFKKYGTQVGQGFVIGIDDMRRDVSKATSRLASAAELTPKALSGSVVLDARSAFAARITADSQPVKVAVKLSAEQISQLQRGREIQADLDIYAAAGGRRAS